MSELGTEAFAHPVDTISIEFEVVSDRVVNGLTVGHIRYPSGVVGDAFTCEDVFFEVRGRPPPTYANFDPFLADYIEALGCTPIVPPTR